MKTGINTTFYARFAANNHLKLRINDGESPCQMSHNKKE